MWIIHIGKMIERNDQRKKLSDGKNSGKKEKCEAAF